jgi:limonene-1,2-epoxide hydrolase
MTTDLAVRLEIRASAFFASWGTTFDEMVDGFQAELAPDCDWDQRPMIRTRTRDRAITFLKIAHHTLGMEYIDVDLLSIAVVGNTVHTQRIDYLRRGDGSLIASAPVAGVLTYNGDQVIEWKEYFDPVVIAGKAAISSALWAGGKALGVLRRP